MAKKVPDTSTLKTQKDLPLEVLPVREIRTLLTWKAPSRPFKKQDKEFWRTVLTIIFLLSVILLFFKEWFLIATIIALAFLYYVLSTVSPEEVEYRLTNQGIRIGEVNYPWEILYRFWFSKKWEQKILNVEGQVGLGGRLMLMIGKQDPEQVKKVIDKYLVHEEAPLTFFDTASGWLSKKLQISTD